VSQSSKPPNPAEPAKAPPGFGSGGADPAGAPDQGGAPDPVSAAAIAPEAVERIERLAAGYLDSIVAMAVGSPEYGRAVAAIDHLGERDFVATAAMSGRLLDRRFLAMRGLLADKAPLARKLNDLRKAAAQLDPTRIKLDSRRSSRDEMEELDRYFERFARWQPRLEALLASLTEGRLALEQDNAAIVAEQTSLATEMETLRQYAFLAGCIDQKLATLIDEIAGTDDSRAESLRLDALPVVRRRHQEILTQLAVVTQGYLALRIVEDTNAEVIRAVASAITTTAAALRTAAVAAGAAANQRAAMEQLETAQLAASAMSNHAAELEAGLSGPGGRVEMLRGAWAEVYAALDRVDAQKARVLKTMSSADLELARPKSVSADRSGEDSRAPGADASLRLR
jgi:uncharacterized protein YaaN involved in tellurite resistance